MHIEARSSQAIGLQLFPFRWRLQVPVVEPWVGFLSFVDGDSAGGRCWEDEFCVGKSLGQGSVAWDVGAEELGTEPLGVRAAAGEDDPGFFVVLWWLEDRDRWKTWVA